MRVRLPVFTRTREVLAQRAIINILLISCSWARNIYHEFARVNNLGLSRGIFVNPGMPCMIVTGADTKAHSPVKCRITLCSWWESEISKCTRRRASLRRPREDCFVFPCVKYIILTRSLIRSNAKARLRGAKNHPNAPRFAVVLIDGNDARWRESGSWRRLTDVVALDRTGPCARKRGPVSLRLFGSREQKRRSSGEGGAAT